MTSLSRLGVPVTKALGEDEGDETGNGQGQDGEVERSIWEEMDGESQSRFGLGTTNERTLGTLQ